MWKSVYEDIIDLTKDEKMKLFAVLKRVFLNSLLIQFVKYQEEALYV